MTIEEKVREIVRTAVDNSLSVDKTTEAILALIKPMSETLQADEVTLAFFRKYLEMPDGTLEDLCGEIIRLKAIKPMSKKKLVEIIFNQIGGELAEQELLRQMGLSGRTVTEIEAIRGSIKGKAVLLADAIIAEWEKGLK